MLRSFVLPVARATAGVFAGTACLAGILFAPGVARAQGLYQPPSVNVGTGATPQGVATADFARTGNQSLAVVSTGSSNAGGNLRVYLATAPGTFASPTNYLTCKKPTAVLAADVNNDGYPDILVSCQTAGVVDLFLNSGNGSFANAVPISVTKPVAMVAGDFANNGTIGVAVARSNGDITTLLNLSATGAGSKKFLSDTGTPTGIAAGDFNHDGKLDVAVSDGANNLVRIYTGKGDGSFAADGTVAAGSQPSAIAAADFNNDGNLDLAVTNAGSNTVSILLGNGDATFNAQANPQSAGLNPVAISVTDVNSDGSPDVIAYDAYVSASTGENAYSVLLGNGDGTLQTPQTVSLSSTPGTVAAVADFNRDGKPDLAFVQQTSNLVSLLINNTLPTPYPGARSFSGANPIAAGNGNMADSITTGDFNQDGNLDVAVSYLQDNQVRVLQNEGGGSFALAGTYNVGQQPYSVVSGDLNGDGFPDLITVNTSLSSPTGTVTVLLNNGNRVNNSFTVSGTYNVGRLPYQAAIGDLNGDGIPDIAVTNYGANTVSILWGTGNGTFTAGPTLNTGTNPYGIAIGDFAHNGRPDIAVTCYGTDMLYIFPNQGDRNFGTPYMYSTGSGPMSLVTGDFNRDGKLDIVVANATGGPAGDTDPTTSGNNISFFAGTGTGTFLNGVISPSLNFPDSIAAGDVNGDGILDIVGVAPNFNAVEVTLGAGDGTFGTIQQRSQGEFTAAKQPWAVALGDFYNDGQLDIVTANTYNQVNIAIPAYQTRYMTVYPVVSGGVPSVDLLTNQSAATISLGISPTPPLPAINSGVTLTATVQPAISGATPTGSVIFEDNTGAPLGTGPYDLDGSGTASYTTGQLGSGQYTFTTLYSGDTLYQPTTASGSNFAVIVAGTPVTLTINPTTVPYGNTFQATVTVTQTGATVPTGTVTIYGTPGSFSLPPITLANGTGSETVTVDTPDFNVGTYELYAYYTPAGGSPYQPGTSSQVALTVTPGPTTTNISCGGGWLRVSCTSTTTLTSSGVPVASGSTVDFTVNGGGNHPETTNGNGQAAYAFGEFIGSFTVKATFPAQTNYLTSNNSTTSVCFIYCGASERSSILSLDSFTGSGLAGRASPATRRNVPFSLF